MIYKKVCPICGTKFETRRHNRKYCSDECVKIANNLYKKKYVENNREKVKESKKKWNLKNPDYNKRYNEEHKEELKIKSKEYRQNNLEHRKEYEKKYREEHKEEIKIKHKEYRLKNKDKIHKKNKERYENNKKVILEKSYEYKRRTKNDPKVKLSLWIRRQLRRCLKSKKDKHTSEIIFYTPEELRECLSSQFIEGMSWDNYGKIWNIDHIKPLKVFNFFNEDGTINYDIVREANGLHNLRPVFCTDNFRKNSTWTEQDEIDYQERLDKTNNVWYNNKENNKRN